MVEKKASKTSTKKQGTKAGATAGAKAGSGPKGKSKKVQRPSRSSQGSRGKAASTLSDAPWRPPRSREEAAELDMYLAHCTGCEDPELGFFARPEPPGFGDPYDLALPSPREPEPTSQGGEGGGEAGSMEALEGPLPWPTQPAARGAECRPAEGPRPRGDDPFGAWRARERAPPR